MNRKPIQRRTKWLIALFTVLACDAGTTCAQNPLRAQSPVQQVESSSNDNQSVLSRLLHNSAEATTASQIPTGASDRLTQQAAHPNVHTDSDIAQASFAPLATTHRANSAVIEDVSLVGAEPNFIQRENAAAKTVSAGKSAGKKQNMGQLVSNIGMNLAFVLSAAIGFILLAKFVMKPKVKAKSIAPSDGALELIQELKLDSKITLRLVQWRSNRILVASDGEGIKSVDVMNPSFEQTLDDLEEADELSSTIPYKPAAVQTPKPKPPIPQPAKKKEQSDVELNEKILRMLLGKGAQG